MHLHWAFISHPSLSAVSCLAIITELDNRVPKSGCVYRDEESVSSEGNNTMHSHIICLGHYK